MKKQKPRFPGQVGDTKVQIVDESFYGYGVYVWKKANGKWFTDGQGNVLSINSRKGDESKIAELKSAASYYGEPEGKEYYFEGSMKITDEQYSEQADRMNQGLIPSENDIGALIAAKKTFDLYGSDE
jgi:hypothetical protein